MIMHLLITVLHYYLHSDGVDYQQLSSNTTLTMDGSFCVSIMLIPDGKLENMEQFAVMLTVTFDSDMYYADIPLSSVTVGIEDSDSKFTMHCSILSQSSN